MRCGLVLENTALQWKFGKHRPKMNITGCEERGGGKKRKVEREKLPQGLHFSRLSCVNHCRLCCGQANLRTAQRIYEFQDNELRYFSNT